MSRAALVYEERIHPVMFYFGHQYLSSMRHPQGHLLAGRVLGDFVSVKSTDAACACHGYSIRNARSLHSGDLHSICVSSEFFLILFNYWRACSNLFIRR